MKKLFFISVILFLAGIFTISADDKFVLVIDPGHGGRDAGAVRGKFKEKDINLQVALALGKLIESNMNDDVKIVYTRKNDKFVDLYKRAEIANKAKANLFISIHTNSTASQSTTAQGADTYILGLARSEENLAVAKRENSVILLEDDYNKRYEGFDPNSPESYIIFEFMTDKYMEQSLQFANIVQKGFTNIAKRRDRGVRQAGFLVLRESAMPSVLIELGFINNPTEASYLSTSTGQRSMASAIFSGLKRYVDDFYKRQGQNVSSTSRNTTREAQAYVPEPPVSRTPAQRETRAASNETTRRSQTEQPAETGSTRPYISKNKDINELQALSTGRSENKEPDNRITVAKVPEPQKEKKTYIPEPPASTTPAKTETTRPKSNVSKDVIEYRVQFFLSKTKLPPNSSKLKGLSPVDEYFDGGYYKYTYGSTTNENEALKIRNEVRKKFKDAFVIVLKNGTRIK